MKERLDKNIIIVRIGIILFFCSILVPFACAKGPVVIESWNRTYGGPEDDIGQGVDQMANQSLVILAFTSSYGAGGMDAWVIKTDEKGYELSNRTYGGLKYDSFRAAKQIGGGEWLLSGLTGSYGAGKLDAWLMRTDEAGNEKWNKTYGGTENDEARGLVIPYTGGILLTGWTNSFGAGQTDAWLIRTYSNGTVNWTKTIGGTGNDKLRSISKTPDGGYILCGETNSSGFGDYDGWLVKTDGNGNIIWEKTFGGPGYDMFYPMNQTSDGGYIITGSTSSFGNGGNDTWLVRVDPDGNELWNHTYGGPYEDIGHRVRQVEDEGFIVSGWTDSFGEGNYDFWLMKTDKNGSMVWNETFGGLSDDKSREIAEMADGSYAVIGYTTSRGAGKKDAWLIKLDVLYPPIANFTANVTFGTAPLNVLFTDLSTNNPIGWAWYFGDETYKSQWTQMNASAGWSGRYMHSSVAMPDGSIELMGGYDNLHPYPDPNHYLNYKNDTWRSTDNGATWTQMKASAEWSGRQSPSSVGMPDGSIVLMGGYGGDSIYEYYNYQNDTWRSTDNGETWMQQTASAEWTKRMTASSVAMPDGSIVLMGGAELGNGIVVLKNDTWRSIDNGETWTQMTASAGWLARAEHSSVAMPDGSIVLMGGWDGYNYKNDTWRSTNKGTTWTQVNASSGWTARRAHSSVAMPDGSIVLMGGQGGGGPYGPYKNDTWRSTDNGKTWTQLPNTIWTARSYHSSVAMPDGSIVLMGGYDGGYKNDTWRLQPAGSTEQNPSHSYTRPGIYNVTLQAYNAGGYNSTRKIGYINVTSPKTKIGVVRNNKTWILDATGNGAYGAGDVVFNYGIVGDVYVTGDWNGNGTTKIGVVRNNNTWLLDASGNGLFGPGDLQYIFGKAGDVYVTGDWNGNGTTKIGVVRFNTTWLLDASGDGKFGPGDYQYVYGRAGDVYVTGDWNGNGTTKIGVVRNNKTWILDASGDGKYGAGDIVYNYGIVGDRFVTGDWNGNGTTKIGVVRFNTTWLLDASGNGLWSPGDFQYVYGRAGDRYVTGKWK